MYFPKSQITTDLTTRGGEFVIQSTGEVYIGSYFKTSSGKKYTGATPQDGPSQLLVEAFIVDNSVIEDAEVGKVGSYNEGANVSLVSSDYAQASKSNVSPTIPPQTSKPKPTKEDYESLKFKRYYLKRTNNFSYKEVNKNTYMLYFNSDPSVQYSLYDAISIDWVISGDLLEAYKTNVKIAGLAEVQNMWLGFEKQFKDRFARYFKKDPKASYYTKGGELKVRDTNEEYVGYYHCHPSQGVLMEGRFHVNRPHGVLVLIKEGEVLNKKRVRDDQEVGTSRRRNVSRRTSSRGGGGY